MAQCYRNSGSLKNGMVAQAHRTSGSFAPRLFIREAFKANLISDEAWMDMLKVRNELTHDYDCEIVKTHCSTIVEKYIDLFYDFEKVVKQLEM